MEPEWALLAFTLHPAAKEKSYHGLGLDRQYNGWSSPAWGWSFKKNGPQSTGRGRKGMSTKIHVGLAPGKIKSACLSEGQRVDMKVFSRLWELGDWEGISYVIADKGYDCYAVREIIRKGGKTPVIPRRQGAICPGVQDKERYKTRSAIERFFGKIKENKRLALRFDKLDFTFFAFFALAAIKVLKLFC